MTSPEAEAVLEGLRTTLSQLVAEDKVPVPEEILRIVRQEAARLWNTHVEYVHVTYDQSTVEPVVHVKFPLRGENVLLTLKEPK